MPAKGVQVPPTRLSAEKHRRLVDACATGAVELVAAKHAGVGLNSFRRWLHRGRDADVRMRERVNELPEHVLAEIHALSDERPRTTATDALPRSPLEKALGEYVEPEHRTCWSLWNDVEKATATFEVTNLALIEEAGRGYDSPETTTVEKIDPETGRVIERTTTTRMKRERQWTALAWLLERRFSDRYARRTVTELTGADGGPLQVAEASPDEQRRRAREMLDEVAAIRAKREEAAQRHADGNGNGQTASDAG